MVTMTASLPAASEQLTSLLTVLDLIRSGTGCTQPELSRLSGLGRTVVTQRVAQLTDYGLVARGDLGQSTGGRAPRQLRFRSEAGSVLAAELGATSISVGLADLSGQPAVQHREPWDIAEGPERTLARVEELFDSLLATAGGADVWGIGVGLPGPVEFATGTPVSPPIMPGWDGYPVRARLASRYGVPVWVDNDVNVMALGELRRGLAQGEEDVIYVKVGTGIGAGLISGGQYHRGAKGCAGDIGHIAVVDESTVVCRCGNTGCLEALAGGAALARDGALAAREGRSPYLAKVIAEAGAVHAGDVASAAASGDQASVTLIDTAGSRIGAVLAALVNFYNPSLIVLGGGVVFGPGGDALLASIRHAIYRRSLPLATRDLGIARSSLGGQGGLIGAALMVVDELLSPPVISRWVGEGSPRGLEMPTETDPAA
jgi:glucokinase-like ROK family protein